jgi:hypothetical protein
MRIGLASTQGQRAGPDHGAYLLTAAGTVPLT